MPAVLALVAAVSFGVTDVIAAVASRRVSSLWVAQGLQIAGLPLLALGMLVIDGRISASALLLGAGAGVVGTLGVALYLRSLAVGPVGVISPVAAVVATAVPVGWGVVVSGDVLSGWQALGVALGLVSVVMVAWSPSASNRAYGRRGPLFAAVAGTTFGLYFVVLDATPADSGLWPLAASRLSGMVVLAGVLLMLPRPRPGRGSIGLILLAGSADAAATLAFLLATRQGLLSLVALLASLSPVVALVLARFALHERLRVVQAVGVLVAMLAIGLIIG